jgi:hypothetical protein
MMRAPLLRYVGAAATLVAALALGVFLLATHTNEIASIRIPPDLKNGSTLELDLTVPEHRAYDIDLDFISADPDEHANIRALVGSAYNGCRQDNSCGITTLFRLEVRDIRGNSIPFHSTTLFGPQGRYAHTTDGTYMRNLGIVHLKPGKYKLIAKAIDVDPLIHSERVNLTVRYDARANPLGN